MTDERYAEINEAMDDLFSQDRARKTVAELVTDYFTSPQADAYFASLPVAEQAEYLDRIECLSKNQ